MSNAYWRAATLLENGRASEALDIITEALTSDPDNADLLAVRANCLNDLQLPSDGLAAAEQSLAIDPNNAAAMFARTVGLRRTKKTKEAVDQARHLVALHSNSAYNKALLVETLLEYAGQPTRRPSTAKKLTAEALQMGRQAVADDPEDEAAHIVLAKANLADEDHDTAYRHVQRALALNPQSVVAHQVGGLIRQAQGDSRAASEHYVAAGRGDRGETSMKLLRNVRTVAPGVGLALIFGTRALLRVIRPSDDFPLVATVFAALFALAAMGYVFWVWRRRRNSQEISAEADRILKADRQLRRASLLGRLRRTR